MKTNNEQVETNSNIKTDIDYEAQYSRKISRLFIFRFLRMFVEMWVMMVWGIWIGILSFLHFWYMLILGRRNESIRKKQLRFMRHTSKWQAYLSLLIDRRPDFIEK